MWAAPDKMADMPCAKNRATRMAGATTAWVPSPTAATLHALHYHQVNVLARQEELKQGGPRAKLSTSSPFRCRSRTGRRRCEAGDRQQLPGHSGLCGALDRPGRRLLQGAGHSRCRADGRSCTLRISSQHLANWLHQGVITRDQVMESLKRMAVVVDKQTPATRCTGRWRPVSTAQPSRPPAIMVFKGREQAQRLHRIHLDRAAA